MVTHAPLRNIPKGSTVMARIRSALHKSPVAASVMLAKNCAFHVSLLCNEKQTSIGFIQDLHLVKILFHVGNISSYYGCISVITLGFS